MAKYVEIAIALGASALLAAVSTTPPQKAQPKPAAAQPSFEKTVRPVIEKYCVACHSGADAMAGVQLDKFKTKAHMVADRDTWDKVSHVLQAGTMPPKGMPAPSASQRASISKWITATLSAECDVDDPGRVTMRRLNRLEYNNTVRDLTGLDLRLADDFPSDDVGYGFDNIGDVLSISPLLMERYLSAAETIANRAIFIPSKKPLRIEGSAMKADGNVGTGPDGEMLMFSQVEGFFEHVFAVPGKHTIRIGAYGQQAGKEPTKLELRLDGKPVGVYEVKATRGKPQVIEHDVELSAGKHRVAVAFINDFYQAGPPAQDRNLFIQFLEVKTPTGAAQVLPDSRRRILGPAPVTDKPKAARQVFARFAAKAFRRPPTTVELDRLVQIAGMPWKDGEPYEQGIRLGIQAILSSPNFIFRVEREGGGQLGSYELASRLSYFIWSSMPDDELFRLAASNELVKPKVLEAQARRMLKSPKARALGDGFAAQWLNLRKLSLSQPDPKRYPDFDEKLRQSMMTETEMFFGAVVAEDRPITQFIDGKFTYIDERLAKLYGIAGVTGEEFRKVSLEGTQRAGILTHASILTLTSNPTRTSPVKRGKWVLEQILNQAPPPPPPGTPDLEADPKSASGAKTIREKMAAHLANPVCASCHVRMDPIGLSLENFDGIGKWRDSDELGPIDASGEFPDGTRFTGSTELRAILSKDRSKFAEAFSERLLTYAIGRGVEASDKCFVEEIAKRVEKEGFKFSSVISGIVTSDPFRLRRTAAKK